MGIPILQLGTAHADTEWCAAGGPHKSFRVMRVDRSLIHHSLDTSISQSPFVEHGPRNPIVAFCFTDTPLSCDDIVLCNYLYLRALARIRCRNPRMPGYPLYVLYGYGYRLLACCPFA